MAALPDCEAPADSRLRMDGATLGELLCSAGLLDRSLAGQTGRLAGRFPAALQRDMFLEYEFAERPVAAGFGLGFAAGPLDHYAATRHWFLRTATGRAIRTALADDPFAADSKVHLNLFGDPDPDCVEYDIPEGRLDTAPFVFFRVPRRFAVTTTPAEVRDLCGAFPEDMETAAFAELLGQLVAIGPASVYRIGVSRRRGAGWWRAIITNLSVDQVTDAVERRGVTDSAIPLGLATRLYEGRLDNPGACFALSVDLYAGRITAIDVECPYLFRIAGREARAGAVAELADGLQAAGLASPQVASWIVENCFRYVDLGGDRQALGITAHHLKFRLFGSPHFRMKAYLHIGMTEAGQVEAWA